VHRLERGRSEYDWPASLDNRHRIERHVRGADLHIPKERCAWSTTQLRERRCDEDSGKLFHMRVCRLAPWTARERIRHEGTHLLAASGGGSDGVPREAAFHVITVVN
jgi:hypothetical protein